MKEQLVDQWKRLAGNMSYFNAAEGPSWSQESEARSSCGKKLKETTKELEALGVDVEELAKGPYLLSTGDYR